MRKLSSLLLCCLFALNAIGQNSWVNIELLTDTYPGETTWKITPPGGTPVLASNDTGMLPNTVYTQFLAVGGQIVVDLEDSYGDGLDASEFGGTIGYFLITNSCQDTILFVEGNFGSLYTDTLTIAPCAPPTIGCTNPLASNYDPNVVLSDDSSCLYPVTFQLDMNEYEGTFTTPEVNGEFNGWCGSNCNPMSDPDGDNIWVTTIDIPAGQYLWKYALDNWTDQELPQLGPNSACFLPDGNGFINRTLVVGPNPQTLPPVCWESCLPCGAILGCTDPNSDNFNPWANLDDGSCQTGAQCGPGQTFVEIKFTPDNYPSESGFKLFGDNGLVLEQLPGNLTGLTPGVPVSFFACVEVGELYDLIIEDSYGDGLCGTCFGGTVNGNVEILDCNGDIIFDLQDDVPDGNFNFLYTTDQFEPAVCSGGPVAIEGCTNPNYLEFNVLADVDDGSCATNVIEGCTDPAAFNYDPIANTTEEVWGFYTLEIFDGAADGWGGTWLGIVQGDWISPQYKIGPTDGNSITFDVPLNIYEPVYAYLFTTPQSITSLNQIGYTLTGPNDDNIIDVDYWDAIPFPFVLESESLPIYTNLCVPIVLGCTDPTAFNWVEPIGDPSIDVNTDDGSCVAVVAGCTNSLAFNYDSTANVDDGSCIATIQGCTDPTAFNYNPNANVSDGNCVYLGCTDNTACNYDAGANVDNGGCIYAEQYYDCSDICLSDIDEDGICDELEIPGCMDPLSLNFNPNATDPDNSCIPIVNGCTDPTAFNYDILANVDDGTCVAVVEGCTDPLAFNYDTAANTNNGTCIPFVYGCTDITAFNYDTAANTDNGSCIPFIYGCTDSGAFNYDPLANTDNGTCVAIVNGCTDSGAFNYDPFANTDDGSCIPILLGCTDPLALNYNDLANTDDGSCIPILLGCTDSTALNYNALANTDDGTCVEIVEGCMDAIAFNFNPNANVDDGSCIAVVEGCTDPTAFNFNSNANVDNGTCVPFAYGCTDPTAFNYDPNANTDNGSCIPVIFGCMDSAAFNYDPTANTDNGSCVPVVFGCTDPDAFTYNPLANTNDNSCCYVGGCTDSNAFNYDPDACFDDGSCVGVNYGCTDVSAYNYDPTANIDDESCLFDAGCYGGPGIPYWLNDECYAWVIDVDSYCCDNDWDASCATLYDYCQQGWPVNVEEYIHSNQVAIYPNPVQDVLNIECKDNFDVEIYDSNGKQITTIQNPRTINFSKYADGIYNMVILVNDVRIVKRVVKQ